MPGRRPNVRARDVIVDVAVFVVVCLASFAPVGREKGSPDALLVLPFMILAGIALFARRRFPVTVLVVCVLIGLIPALFGIPHTPGFSVPIAIAIYTVARLRSRALTIWLAAALVVLLPLEELLLAGGGFGATDVAAPVTLQPAVLVAFATALGSAIRYYFDALESARERAHRAEESREAEARRRVAEDRLAIARDLHDSVAHRIAVINLQAGVAARSVRADPEEAEGAIAIVGDAARNVLSDLNDMLGLLRATGEREIVDEPDFAHIEGLLNLFAKSGLKVHMHLTGEPRPLRARTGTIAYRVVQEALTNAYKHGRDRTADLELDYSPQALVIRVSNPAPDAASLHDLADGHGLTGMRERLAEIGGTLALDPANERFGLTATLPDVTPAAGESDDDRSRTHSDGGRR